MKNEPDLVDFGFEKVSSKEKTAKVTDVFRRVSSKYDLMNDVMSGGLHRLWKTWFVNSLPMQGQAHYLDVAGGTGDIAFNIYKNLVSRGLRSEITICDINSAMLAEGQKKFSNTPMKWSCGNAEALPFTDNSVDVYTIAFGLRNVTNKIKALEEAHRVLKPGGTFACMEFSKVTPILEKPYELYSFKILPLMGKFIANDPDAYQYLAESIKKFPDQETLKTMMSDAGLSNPSYENYSGGIVSVHRAIKAA